MKSMNKVCALLVCASMAFSVFGCSSDAEGKPNRSSDDAEETEIEETEIEEIDDREDHSDEDDDSAEETVERSSDENAVIEIPRGEVSEADVNEFLSNIPSYWVIGDYQVVYSDDFVTVSAMPLYISASASDVVSTWPMIIWKTENHCSFTVSVDGNGDFQTDAGLTEGMYNHFSSYVEPGSTGYNCTDFQTVEGGTGSRADDGNIYLYDVINEVYFSADIESYNPDDGYEDIASSQIITVDFSVLGTPDYS